MFSSLPFFIHGKNILNYHLEHYCSFFVKNFKIYVIIYIRWERNGKMKGFYLLTIISLIIMFISFLNIRFEFYILPYDSPMNVALTINMFFAPIMAIISCILGIKEECK